MADINLLDIEHIKDNEFNKLSVILKNLTGIHLPLNSKNLALMSSRLRKVLVQLNINSYKDFLIKLENNDPIAVKLFISAMTTNTTYFFREKDHFDFLAQNIHKICSSKKENNNNELRIWCAAASSGEEAYTILITLLEQAVHTYMQIKMLATDIDPKVIRQAIDGIYSQERLEEVPLMFKQKYFTMVKQGNEKLYAIKEELKSYIKFGILNLLDSKYPFKHKFDIIFCRNVLIYFDNQTSKTVVNRLVDVLAEGGYLFLGHSETIAGQIHGLQRVGSAVYQKRLSVNFLKISA